MRKTREEKAITLIALIITIVVLLILAVVAINSITGDGIIQHAVNAKTEYEKAQSEENSILSYYEDYLVTEGKAGTWKQEGEYIVNADGVKIPIGAKVNYTPVGGKTYTSPAESTGIIEDQIFVVPQTSDIASDIEWYVMGVEHGKIILLASKGIVPQGANTYILYGKDGYNNSVEELNRISSIYGTGKGAESARSINGDDIEKLTGITTEEQKESRSLENYDYGAKYRYEYKNGEIKMSKDGGTEESLSLQTIYLNEGVIDRDNPDPKEIISYAFNIDMDRNDIIQGKLLDGQVTYIATRTTVVIDTDTNNGFKRGWIGFSIRCITDINNSAKYNRSSLYSSLGKEQKISSANATVRPVVILKSDTVLTESNGVYNITK